MSEQVQDKIVNRLPIERRKTLADPTDLLNRLSLYPDSFNLEPKRRATLGNPENLIKSLRATCSAPNILVKPDITILQNAITKSKKVLIESRVKLGQFSVIEHSASKMAAYEEYYQAEKDVEEACMALCKAKRTK